MPDTIDPKPLKGENIDFAYEVMSKKLEAQDQAHNALESKIGILVGFIGAIVGGGTALVISNHLLGCNLFSLGLAGLYVALAILIIASATTTYYSPPSFKDVCADDALSDDLIKVKKRAIDSMVEGYEINIKLQDKKGRRYNAALQVFFASMIIIFLSLIISQTHDRYTNHRTPAFRTWKIQRSR